MLSLFFTTIALTLLDRILITTASPLAPISLSIITNTTTPATSTVLNNIQCIDSSDWVTYKFIAGDCFSAIGLFQDYEVENHHAKTVFEFVPSDVVPTYAQFTQRTPRKYAYKSCTMAIVMLTELHALGLDVPRLPAEKKWARTDLSDYTAIENAILNVRDGCLSVVVSGSPGGGGGEEGGAEKREGGGEKEHNGGKSLNFANPVGYDITGHHGSIGVFLWDTNSMVNQIVKDAYNVFEIGANGGNGTGVVETS